MVSGETASWEDTQLQSIIQDHTLLQSFQTLKYANGEPLSRVMLDGAADSTGHRRISRSFGQSVLCLSQIVGLCIKKS
jgi:hypothetical protein